MSHPHLRPHRLKYLARQLAFAEDAMPDLEVDQQPEPIAMVGGAIVMRLSETPDGCGLEQAAVRDPRPQHELFDHRPEPVTQPASDGHRKSHLPAG